MKDALFLALIKAIIAQDESLFNLDNELNSYEDAELYEVIDVDYFNFF